ncbi:MAG TPA: glutamyl-tRNA reductase [Candidatus Thermoplasmatota archaeon]|nr:glutamyl-tRNA reductase [Candidatus Thermoplasmatota archaeon]
MLPASQAERAAQSQARAADPADPASEAPFFSIHITHQWARLEDMEPLSRVNVAELLAQARALPGCEEVAVVKTCNRVEFYFVTRQPESLERAATKWLSGFVAPPLLRSKHGLATCEHLLRVASGIESMLVGEDQILGQVRQSWEAAAGAGCTGRHLGRLFGKAIQVGKKVRAETELNRGSVSLGRAAVKLALSEGPLADKTVLLLGTGETAELVAAALAEEKPARLLVVSKTAARASALAARAGGLPLAYAELSQRLAEADVVFAATTAGDVLLDARRVRSTLGASPRPVLFLDLSNPRALAPDVATVEGVRLVDLDGLRAIAAENLDRRRGHVQRAEEIVAEELALLSARLAEDRAEAILAALYGRVKRIRDGELDRAAAKLALDDEGRRVLADLANSILNKVLSEPTLVLKRMARENDSAGIESAAKVLGIAREESP